MNIEIESKMAQKDRLSDELEVLRDRLNFAKAALIKLNRLPRYRRAA